ncbi:MAG: hypothetical protein E7009_02400 [Alphaproteobacteria bacterium]|nr:hypothetical protein [Alphaproteobacteria bacterium]
MVILETLFDVLSASVGAVIGVFVGFVLNRKTRKKMATQVVISRQALDKIKLENSELLKRIQDKENIILKMQMQILGNGDDAKTQKPKTQKKK